MVEAIGAVCVLQDLKRILEERTERERQSNLGKILDELAEKHITQEQLKNAHAGDLERDRFEAAQMCDNFSSEYHVVSQVGSAADVEHGFLGVKEVRDMLSTVQAWPPVIAVYSVTTAVTDVDTTVAKTKAPSLEIAKCLDKEVNSTVKESAGEVPQQSRSLLAMVQLGLQGLRSTAPQQSLQQWKSLLVMVKLGLLGLQWPQQNSYSHNVLVSFMMKLGLLSSQGIVPRKIRTCLRRSHRFTLSWRTRNACLRPSQRKFGK